MRLLVQQCCREFRLCETATQDVKLAVDEAVSNIIRHSYRGAPDRPIRVACGRSEDSIWIEICDDGVEFDPFAKPVQPPEALRGGGRGIYLIRSVMDGCEYVRDGGWNRIRLSKRLPAAVDLTSSGSSGRP